MTLPNPAWNLYGVIWATASLTKVDVHNLAECELRFVNRVKSTGRWIYSETKAMRLEEMGCYHNFGNALERFASIVERRAEFEEDGYGAMCTVDLAVKRFEFTFEMAWKAMKRGLAFLGLECKSPRGCIQEVSRKADPGRSGLAEHDRNAQPVQPQLR